MQEIPFFIESDDFFDQIRHDKDGHQWPHGGMEIDQQDGEQEEGKVALPGYRLGRFFEQIDGQDEDEQGEDLGACHHEEGTDKDHDKGCDSDGDIAIAL